MLWMSRAGVRLTRARGDDFVTADGPWCKGPFWDRYDINNIIYMIHYT